MGWRPRRVSQIREHVAGAACRFNLLAQIGVVVESEHLVGAEPRVLEDIERHRAPLSVLIQGDQAFLSSVDDLEHDESLRETVGLGEIVRRMGCDRREEIGRRVDMIEPPVFPWLSSGSSLLWFCVLYLT